MAVGAEQRVDWAMGGEKALGIAGGLESAHRSLPLSGRLVGQLGAIVRPLVLAVLDAGNQLLNTI